MKLAFYSIVLNHHQACIADEFYKLLGSDYVFVETIKCNDSKGAVEDYSNRPYLLKAWESEECWQKAMNIANTADVCVFGGNESIPFEISRMKRNLLSFDMGERMLKRGWINLISPHLLKKQFVYLRYGWAKKNLYKLCCSAFSKEDLYKLHSLKINAINGDISHRWIMILMLKHPWMFPHQDLLHLCGVVDSWC